MNFTLSLAVICEIGIGILGLFSILRKKNLAAGESYCYAAILMFAVFSVSIQCFFFLNIQNYYYLFDIALLTFSSVISYKSRKDLFITTKNLLIQIRSNKYPAFFLLLLLVYLFFQVLLLPPYNWDSMTYHLARVLMFQEEGSIFLKNFTQGPQAMHPWGWDILTFLFLRFYTDYCLSIFSFISYTIIVVCTYTLVNKLFKDALLSMTSTFVIASLKLLILEATTTKNDIAAAAIAIVCFLAGYCFLYSLKGLHLFIVLVSLLFGFTVKSYFAGFAIPFLLLFSIILLKKYSPKEILLPLKYILRNKTLMILPLGILFCLVSYWLYNLHNYGNIQGSNTMLEGYVNNNFLGMAANVLRYFLEILDLPTQYCSDMLVKIHDRILGDSKFIAILRYAPFILLSNHPPREGMAWYGPLGILLIIPSLFYAIIKGKEYVRFVAFSLLGFFLALCYTIVWQSSNSRFFSLFFACSGIPVAFLLKYLIKNKYLRSSIFIISSGVILYSVIFNNQKPFITSSEIKLLTIKTIDLDLPFMEDHLFSSKKRIVFKWIDNVIDRNAYYNKQFPSNDVLTTFKNQIPPNKRLLLTGNELCWVFPFLLIRPDLHVIVASPDHILLKGNIYDITRDEDYTYLKNEFDYILCYGIKICERMDAKKSFCFSNTNKHFSVSTICIHEL